MDVPREEGGTTVPSAGGLSAQGDPGTGLHAGAPALLSPLKNTILWSLVLSYTASTLSRFRGKPRQNRWI